MKRFIFTVLLMSIVVPQVSAKSSKKASADSRTSYLNKIMQQTPAPNDVRTEGSLWTPDSAFTDLSGDYKARHLNDLITIQIVQSTSAQSAGTLNSQRTFSTNSAITGVGGGVDTSLVNPLLAANSATNLKGQGQAATSSTLRTNLTGQVIAVMPNGNLVVEAQRDVVMNRENETVVVRGIIRPGDVAPGNIVPSTALSNLELELKGKGVISDSTRQPNFVMRAILKVIGF